MRITPKSEAEIADEGLLPDGTYGFEVRKAEDTISKSSGADMITLTLAVFTPDGNSFRLVTDYLLEKMAYKLRHACDACGIIDKYESGTFSADDFIGKTGHVKIKKQPGTDDFPMPKNTVQDYVVPKDAPTAAPVRQTRKPAPAMAGDDPFGDEIPF